MRIAFWIFLVITGFLTVGAYGGYRAMTWSYDVHEGGDAFGPIGFFGFVGMVLFSLLSIISAMITVGIWIGERNHNKRNERVLEL